ncbi:TPA: hypothetical protein L3544_000759 [Escherichia coli]|nr:hypothetical protein [Escherichia coli]
MALVSVAILILHLAPAIQALLSLQVSLVVAVVVPEGKALLMHPHMTELMRMGQVKEVPEPRWAHRQLPDAVVKVETV